MSILVVGANGKSGRVLVERLLKRGSAVKIMVRSTANLAPNLGDNLGDNILNNNNLTIIKASLLDISILDLLNHLKGVEVIVSCLGHNLTFKGIYGKPRKLVTEAVKRFYQASKQSDSKLKFILMNSAGCRNKSISEPVSFWDYLVVGLVSALLPPHSDNEAAINYLSQEVGVNDKNFEWVAVRPDSLVDLDTITKYSIHPSPIRSAIFNPGKTSRINLADFMIKLSNEKELWNKWKGKMPVIYNDE